MNYFFCYVYFDLDFWWGKWSGEIVYYFYCVGDDFFVDFRMVG